MASPELIPDWITAVATVGAVVVAAAAIWPAARQVRLAAEQAQKTAARDAQDSEERTRPYVSVDLVPGVAGSSSVDAVIENYGKSTARDIRLSLADREFGALSEGDRVGPALGRLFAAGFDLPPGGRRRIFWHMPARPSANPPGALGAPQDAEVVVAYGWTPSDGRTRREYSERLRYNLDDVLSITPVPDTGPKAAGSGIDVEAKNVVHSLRAVAQHLGALRH